MVPEICNLKIFYHWCSCWFSDHFIYGVYIATSLLVVMFLLSIEKFSSTVFTMMRFECGTPFRFEFIESHVKQLSFLLIIASFPAFFGYLTAISYVLFNQFFLPFFLCVHSFLVSLLCISSSECFLALATYEEVNHSPLHASWLARCSSSVVLLRWLLLLFSMNIMYGIQS